MSSSRSTESVHSDSLLFAECLPQPQVEDSLLEIGKHSTLSSGSTLNGPTFNPGFFNPVVFGNAFRPRSSDKENSPSKTAEVSKACIRKFSLYFAVQRKDYSFYPRSFIAEVYKSLKFMQALPHCAMVQKKVYFPPVTRNTLVFDLDETLVHTTSPSTRDPTVSVGLGLRVGVKLRPFARECLQKASELFEVIVFTASHKAYADAVLDYLDPSKKLIAYRLYRGHCTALKGVFIKDLRVLATRDLERVVLVDNAVHSFAYQPSNGIPVVPWYGDSADSYLEQLMRLFKPLSQAKDVRPLLQTTVELARFYQEPKSRV